MENSQTLLQVLKKESENVLSDDNGEDDGEGYDESQTMDFRKFRNDEKEKDGNASLIEDEILKEINS